eukprot:GEMP01040834.1.p1 GENE.GEMP01040834.1~~GEMP01040834.1.p1  ORF type:complete len:200 (+),score=27.55 GEMP01040834.1:200-799(+)
MPIIKEEKLHSFPTDFDGLKAEVQSASNEDWKYAKVDDAKKRAIYTSRNYDEFRALVQGCTLKPIHRHEFNAPPAFQYNQGIKGKCAADSNVASLGDASLTSDFKPPRNGSEFYREFRRAEDQVAWLKKMPLDKLAVVFKTEIDVEVFTKLISILHAMDDREFAKEFATRLRTDCCQSIEFALNFLSKKEKEQFESLLT